jgi:hypothetical protein
MLALLLEKWTRAVFSSMGVELSESHRSVFWISVQFNAVTITKLFFAAFFWSLGFMAINGEECWGKDTSFSRTPTEDTCTIDALVLSGFFASASLVLTVLAAEYLTFVREDRKSSTGTLLLLLWSVWISDAFWSVFNWLAFSIAVKITGEDYASEYSLAEYSLGGVPAFLMNGLFFYIVHNLSRIALITCASLYGETLEKLWFCDALFALVVAGAYYGFGPIAVSFTTSAGATTMLGISFLNALGTAVGTIVMLAILYWIPFVLWAQKRDDNEKVMECDGMSGEEDANKRDTIATEHSAIHSL